MSTQDLRLSEDARGKPNAVGVFPCSATQERCWFLDQLTPGNPALNVAFRWTVRGRFSARTLEAAIGKVIARHEILRTRFAERDGQPVQEVLTTARFALSEIDMRASPGGPSAERVEAILMEAAGRPFDLGEPGLIRATLVRISNEEAILAITLHQIVFDGWSIAVLGREVADFAGAIDTGEDIAFDELPLQYADYALWQREYFKSASYDEDLAYWRDRLTDAPYLELSPDMPRPLERTTHCRFVHADLPPAFGDALDAAAKARSMSPFAFGAAVLAALLGRVTNRSDITFGTQVAGRIDVDLEPLIGVFINNVVLRFALHSDRPFDTALAQARDVVNGALAHQSVPFNRLVELVNPVRDPSRTPLISINYMLQDAFMPTLRRAEFELSSAPSHAPGAIYDLNFQIVRRATGARMMVEYNSDLFTEATATALIELWQSAFRLAVRDPSGPVNALALPNALRRNDGADADRLAPIEAALLAHPLVEEAAVILAEEAEGVERTHAFITPSPAATMPLETLPELIASDLSAAAPGTVPDGVSVLRAMPRDASGALLKMRLTLPPRPVSVASPAQIYGGESVSKEIEGRVGKIWGDILGEPEISRYSDFFDLGGHSLLCVRMLSEIQRAFSVRPSLNAIYRSPTLAGFAAEIAELIAPLKTHAEEEDWRVIEVHPSGPGVTVVGINNVGMLHALRATDPGALAERRMFCVRFFEPGRDHDLQGLDLPAIASRYVDLILSRDPNGPFVLFGECLHGVIAYEIARQLRERSRRVLLLATLNMWHPTYAGRLGARQKWRLRFRAVRDNFATVRAGQKTFVQFLANYSLPHRLGVFKVARALRLIKTMPFQLGSQERTEFLMTLVAARDTYEPAPSDLPILQLLTPDSVPHPYLDPSLGWTGVATGPLDILPVRPAGSPQSAHPELPSVEESVAQALIAVDLRAGEAEAS